MHKPHILASELEWASGKECLLSLLRDPSKRELLSTPLVRLLMSTTTFQTSEVHARRFVNSLSLFAKLRHFGPLLNDYRLFAETEQLKLSFSPLQSLCAELLEVLAHRGLLISQSELTEKRLRNSGKIEAPSSISVCGIITRNRPEQAARALESYIVNHPARKERVRWLVSDDSDATNLERLRILLREVSSRQHVPIELLHRGHRESLVDILATGGTIPRDAIQFLLCRESYIAGAYGITRNMFLLASIGALCFCADDDTLCRPTVPARAPSRKDLRFGGIESSAIEEYVAAEQLTKHVTDLQGEVFADHEKYVGRELCSLQTSKEDWSDYDTEQAGEVLHGHLLSGEGSVAISVSGLYGDSGSDSSLVRLYRHAFKPERGSAAESKVTTTGQTYSDRTVVRYSARPCIYETLPLMAGFYAFDNRQLLPPFFPYHRNEDACFGEMLRTTSPHLFSAAVPSMLFHDPASVRMNSEPWEEINAEVLLPNLVGDLIRHVQPSAAASGCSFELLAQAIADCAALPGRAFAEKIEDFVVRNHGMELEKLARAQQRVKRHSAPCLASIEKVQDALRAQLRSKIAPVPLSQLLNLEAGERESLARRYLASFSSALRHWRSVRSLCEGLLQEGRFPREIISGSD
jgi:hypothetical protein